MVAIPGVSVSIADGIEDIGYHALYGEDLHSIWIPDSIECIETVNPEDRLYLINGSVCHREQSSDLPWQLPWQGRVTVYTSNPYAEYFAAAHQTTCIATPDRIVHKGARIIRIPEGITKINSGDFRDCKEITSVIVPDSVTSIPGGVFYGCSSLESITIPESVSEISNVGTRVGGWRYDAKAFEKCPNLTIHTPTGSNAEQYAAEHNIPCKTYAAAQWAEFCTGWNEDAQKL